MKRATMKGIVGDLLRTAAVARPVGCLPSLGFDILMRVLRQACHDVVRICLMGHGRTAPCGSKADEADGANEASLRRIIAVSCWPELGALFVVFEYERNLGGGSDTCEMSCVWLSLADHSNTSDV